MDDGGKLIISHLPPTKAKLKYLVRVNVHSPMLSDCLRRISFTNDESWQQVFENLLTARR